MLIRFIKETLNTTLFSSGLYQPEAASFSANRLYAIFAEIDAKYNHDYPENLTLSILETYNLIVFSFDVAVETDEENPLFQITKQIFSKGADQVFTAYQYLYEQHRFHLYDFLNLYYHPNAHHIYLILNTYAAASAVLSKETFDSLLAYPPSECISSAEHVFAEIARNHAFPDAVMQLLRLIYKKRQGEITKFDLDLIKELDFNDLRVLPTFKCFLESSLDYEETLKWIWRNYSTNIFLSLHWFWSLLHQNDCNNAKNFEAGFSFYILITSRDASDLRKIKQVNQTILNDLYKQFLEVKKAKHGGGYITTNLRKYILALTKGLGIFAQEQPAKEVGSSVRNHAPNFSTY